MAATFADFAKDYVAHVVERKGSGLPPLPLVPAQVEAVTAALEQSDLPDISPESAEGRSGADALRYLLDERVPQGTYPASLAKIEWLAGILGGTTKSPHVSREAALVMLGHMGGGAAADPLIRALGADAALAEKAGQFLATSFLISPDQLARVAELAAGGNGVARSVLTAWDEGEWVASRPEVPALDQRFVMRTTGEINTDFLSPAQHAPTRDDIPLHALQMLSTSPHDRDFLDRLAARGHRDVPVMLAGDVLGTGSSRKSASNSLVWWIGEDIPHMPNKRRGGVVMAGKIAPIFFNTLRGCGAVPIRCDAAKLAEGAVITIDYGKGEVRDESGTVLAGFEVEPQSILDEVRAGGRNNLIIGRKLTSRARQQCAELGIEVGAAKVSLSDPPSHAEGQAYSLAQKLVGKAAGLAGVLPGDYVEPQASIVFSQDTTGRMTQQEIQELACTRFPTVFIQSFCHTAAGPKSKDALMQATVGDFVRELGGIDLRPGDGVIHTNGNRFLLPTDVGTGGDSHTRFPVGLSFPAGSDLVAFAAAQGFLPLDMPESVLVRFQGKPQPGITARDLVHAIAWAAIQQGKVNIPGKGEAKQNVFSDRVLEVAGLEWMTVDEAFKITDASAERSAAGCAFWHDPKHVEEYVRSCRNFLATTFAPRHPAPVVEQVVARMDAWLEAPVHLSADEGATYADIVEIDLAKITEPILAAPNDPDKSVTLTEAGGTSIDEIFIGSCMVDITDFRAAAAILQGERIQHRMKAWTVPPDRESNVQLGREGVLGVLLEAGANVHVPGCSLCMGNQGQVATGATVVSTSTRNFDNRMGTGAQVYLGSAYVAAMTALLGHIPTVDEYTDIWRRKVASRLDEINRPLRFD
ncbi:MAG: bifunctional aconitate hydratase 2/2-methylisocitrate dehydratase [Deltaproteobacteria bacterium]|jgi:aconitate hydratase 2/2-methylisocitrate dehydratase|nr:bifunctional aconitate hydratase 2/2-methylisocitrate dehydratase [Deltaproteobacteria bacterium]MBW2537544.1 bifunctional aconitate hydratase 2/2-methylisocitrate dehydratase [Deltaproteobacteria bacterium]